MTENERVALAWVRNYLRGHHCDRCGREWITAASTAVLVHRCVAPVRRIVPHKGARERVEEDRAEWARRALGFTDALETAVEKRDGPDALLREVDE